MAKPKLKVHKGGATSTYLGEVRYDLVPLAGIRAVARRAYLGAIRHGEFNYLRSCTDKFANERLSHLIQHVFLFAKHHRMEDLDAIIFNGMMLSEFKERGCLVEREDVVPPERRKSKKRRT